MSEEQNIYQFELEGLEGGTIKFADFKGKKILVVNTASECGFTPQYAQLQEVYESLKDKLMIVGVPSNQFGAQEPGNETEIASFCQRNYGVSFPMSKKYEVIGSNQHPLYQWLTHQDKNGVKDATVRWNFHKFLIDENGYLISDYPSNIEPASEEILGQVD